MDATEVARAVDAARAAVGAPADCEYSWRPVTRLDPGRPPYLLVGLGGGGSGWVVALSPDGVVQGRAADPDGARAWWSGVDGELVWAPGSWSRSPLYPLRRVARGDEMVLLDHEGRLVPDAPDGPGG
ncbi:MAG TPA: hypothetical protein VFL10_04240 [Ornithinibacter sp.]|nr:hypothetical protein [Ornithinibacter sp.]